MKLFLKDPLFLSGLFLRLALLALAVPYIQTLWFVPFLEATATTPTPDPWLSYFNAGGDTRAFPYGFVMYLAFLPATLLGMGLEHLLGIKGFVQLGFACTIFVSDLLLFYILRRLNPGREKQVMILYWLSPITLFVCYWHGQNDIIPITLLMLAFGFLKRRSAGKAGLFSALAISAKLGMILPLPIMMVYIWRKGGWESVMRFLRTFLPFAAVLIAPFFLLTGLKTAVLHSPEVDKIFYATLTLAPGMKVYLTPIIYALLMYLVIKIRRVDFGLLISLSGLSFLSLLLLAPTSVGWYLWVTPFLISYYIRSKNAALLTLFLHVVAFSFQGLNASGAYVHALHLDATQAIIHFLPLSEHIFTLWLSAAVVAGALLFIGMMQYGVFGNYAFKLSKQPIMIGIAGDSGTGKDTLNNALSGLFYKNDVVSVFGDDYHLWERGAPEWKTYTHLNPAANDLDKFYTDIKRLKDGKDITNRSYDHSTGLFTAPIFIRQRDLIIAFGLHTFFLPNLRKLFDVKLFMDMDENLRRYFKVQRDVHERGHTLKKVMAAILRRQGDAKAFIKPQKKYADIVFKIAPERALSTKKLTGKNLPPLKLSVTLQRAMPCGPLLEKLGACCVVKQRYMGENKIGVVELNITNINLNALQTEAFARELFPYFQELLSATPRWQGSTMGLMQLFTLMCLYDRRK